jgi:hypothetical protein
MNLQKLFLGLLLWIVPLTIFAQRYISGQITDAKFDDPISGVSVFIAGTTIGMTTDEKGYYKLAIPRTGSYRLTAAHASYQPIFIDIAPGQKPVVIDIKMQIRELEGVTVEKKIKSHIEDINLFWETILGKNPSKRTIYATNPQTPYFYYDSEKNTVKVTCHEPLEIINNGTGYAIHYVLKYFTHDYNTQITSWAGEYMFDELKPKSLKEKNTWGKNRKKVYSVSITNFIRSLYRDSLNENGFSLFKDEFRRFFSTDGRGKMTVLTPLASNDLKFFLQFDESKSYKTLYIPADTTRLMLVCFGKPVKKQDKYDIFSNNRMKSIGLFRTEIHTNEDSIRIFPDGTFENKLAFSHIRYYSEPLTGLNMTLPVEYGLDFKSEEPRTDIEELKVMSDEHDYLANSLEDVAKRFEMQLSIFPQEKVYIQTDKPYYLSGEQIWFRAHVVDAVSHVPIWSANCVYAELFDARDSSVCRVKVGFENDAYSGYLPIPEGLPEGDYTLRAYTNTMLDLDEDYFFMKNIHIINSETPSIQSVPNQKQTKSPLPEDDFDVSFYPEGGETLYGCMGRIACKAMQRDGTAINVSGTVYDREGNEITQFKTDIRGMGQFRLYPVQGKTYYAVCVNSEGQSKQFELPVAKQEGYALSASWFKDQLHVEVHHSESQKTNDTLYLIVHTRGVVQDARILENTNTPIVFPIEIFPSGVSNLLLLNKNLLPLSERLVFVSNDDQANVVCTTDTNIYSTRSLVEFTVNLTDESGELLQGNVSVAVTDNQAVAVDTTANILTSLLLTSDLRGNIFDPAFYSRKDTRSVYALDLLMLTQGWRRYDTERIIRNDFQYPDTFLEKGYEISGMVTQKTNKILFNKKIPADSIDVNILSVSGDYFGSTLTDSAGRFYLSIGDAPDSTWFAVQATPQKGRGGLELTLDKLWFPERNIRVAPLATDRKIIDVYAEKAKQQYVNEQGIRMIQLKEIAVKAKKLPERRSSTYLTSDYSLTEDQLNRIPSSSITNLFMRVPRVVLSGNSGALKLSISGMTGAPYVLIDGAPVIVPNDTKTSIDDLLIASDVAHVDVLTSTNNLSAYGIDGGGGVIAIYTRTGKRNAPKDEPYIKRIMPLGFQKPVEFYAPKYDTPDNDSKPDLRTTIHWLPSLSTDETGKASFQFYTADSPSTYSVVIEGVTNNGKIIYKRGKIVVDTNNK